MEKYLLKYFSKIEVIILPWHFHFKPRLIRLRTSSRSLEVLSWLSFLYWLTIPSSGLLSRDSFNLNQHLLPIINSIGNFPSSLEGAAVQNFMRTAFSFSAIAHSPFCRTYSFPFYWLWAFSSDAWSRLLDSLLIRRKYLHSLASWKHLILILVSTLWLWEEPAHDAAYFSSPSFCWFLLHIHGDSSVEFHFASYPSSIRPLVLSPDWPMA